MACSKFEYVKGFEQESLLLPNTWAVFRLDGRSFTKIAKAYGFKKPIDDRGLKVMCRAAMAVMRDISDMILAYGHSDEFSFVLHSSSNLFNRRETKLLTTVVSVFTAAYVLAWLNAELPDFKEDLIPSFDGRVILFPSTKNLRDYLSWRQADCHINNLYNYAFWGVVSNGAQKAKAYERLKDTNSAEKNEILFSECGINYNKLPSVHRKGTTLLRSHLISEKLEGADLDLTPLPAGICVYFDDIIADTLWNKHPALLRQ